MISNVNSLEFTRYHTSYILIRIIIQFDIIEMRGNSTMNSFTVQNDLLSQSSISNMKATNRFAQFKPVRVTQKRAFQLEEQAKKQIYKAQNDKLFNPFEHRLSKGFGVSQEDIFTRQKERLQQQIKKQQEDAINQCRNYTIMFHDQKVQNKINNSIFKMAAGNILPKPTIREQEGEQDSQPVHRPSKVNNNYIRTPVKSVPKPIPSRNSKSSIQQFNRQHLQSPSNISSNSSQKESKKIVQNRQSSNIRKPNNGKLTNFPPKPSNKKDIQSKEKKKFSDFYEGPDMNLVQQLQSQIVQSPNIGFSQIAELDTAKELLQQAVLLPKLMPEFFKGIRRATKGILLFGPPGTGKTMLAKAVSKGNVFFNVSASSLASKWRGQSEKLVRILFQMAKFYAPSVIFFDQIDALGSRRSQDEGEANRKVKTQLLVQMDGVNSDPEKHVFVLAATNRPWDLDEALRRRLQKRIYIPLPSQSGRAKMFQINLLEIKTDAKVNFKELGRLTKDYSGADIAIVCRQAAYMPMRKKLASLGGLGKIGAISQLQNQIDVPITQQDLLSAIKGTNKSVGNNDLVRYKSWMKQFGST